LLPFLFHEIAYFFLFGLLRRKLNQKGGKKMARTRADQKRRSKQSWERGRGARKIGNPRYRPSTCMRNGKRVKCYRVRK
jgi:hypothetical protein